MQQGERDGDGGDAPFRDAEAWLAELGVRREPIRLADSSSQADTRSRGGGGEDHRARTTGADAGRFRGSGDEQGEDAPGRTPVSPREAARLATEAGAGRDDPATPGDGSDGEAGQGAAGALSGRLEDDVAAALSFIRRSTVNAPQSAGRLRGKLEGRDHPRVVIDIALERAHDQGLVDDRAMAAVLIEEGRSKGHAVRRLRADLKRRGFERQLIDELVAPFEAEDPEVLAFDLARRRAERLRGVDAETAVRRIVGYLARRGHPDLVARKVARQAVFADREPQRTAER